MTSSFVQKLCHLKEAPNPKHADFTNQLKPKLNSYSIDSSITIELPERTPISSQLGIGSCAANATADACELIMSDPVIQISRLALYWGGRNYHNATDLDEGTYISYIFDFICRNGICPESEWPYDISKVFYQPPIEAFMIGSSNRLNSFYRINSFGSDRLDDIDSALHNNTPVVFGTGVDKAFTTYYRASEDDESTGLLPPNKILGYHAMVIVGLRYRENHREYKIRNSWGTLWGRFGYTWLHEDYITWNETSDLWVPSKMPLIKTY